MTRKDARFNAYDSAGNATGEVFYYMGRGKFMEDSDYFAGGYAHTREELADIDVYLVPEVYDTFEQSEKTLKALAALGAEAVADSCAEGEECIYSFSTLCAARDYFEIQANNRASCVAYECMELIDAAIARIQSGH